MCIVSIIIPTYGGGEHLVSAINSCFSQDYQDIEVIVVDDNGQGTENQKNTYDRILPLLADNRLKYIVHDINKNGSAARNTGAKNSTGKYLAFLDDDDIFLTHKIRSQVEQLQKLDSSWGMSYCSSITYMDRKFIRTRIVKKSGNLLYQLLRHKVVIGSTSILMRKEAFEAVDGFDESFWRHQDYEFTARVASKYKIIANPTICFERHLTFRNGPKSIEKSKEYRIHYLTKMETLIRTFDDRSQKKIRFGNMIGVLVKYLRRGKVKTFIKEFRELNTGLLGFGLLTSAIFTYVSNALSLSVGKKFESKRIKQKYDKQANSI